MSASKPIRVRPDARAISASHAAAVADSSVAVETGPKIGARSVHAPPTATASIARAAVMIAVPPTTPAAAMSAIAARHMWRAMAQATIAAKRRASTAQARGAILMSTPDPMTGARRGRTGLPAVGPQTAKRVGKLAVTPVHAPRLQAVATIAPQIAKRVVIVNDATEIARPFVRLTAIMPIVVPVIAMRLSTVAVRRAAMPRAVTVAIGDLKVQVAHVIASRRRIADHAMRHRVTTALARMGPATTDHATTARVGLGATIAITALGAPIADRSHR